MCGRYTITRPQEAADQFEPDEIEADLSRPRYNVAPTQNVPALIVRNARRAVVDLHWGLVPAWAKDRSIGPRLINARAESVDQKPSFKNAFRNRRCLILADGFYEWQKRGREKQPMFVRVDGGKPFALAGLYEIWRPGSGDELASCTIITTQSNELMQTVHDRMPVILPFSICNRWLDPGLTDITELIFMLLPYEAERMDFYPVSVYVNSPGHDDPRCIEKVES